MPRGGVLGGPPRGGPPRGGVGGGGRGGSRPRGVSAPPGRTACGGLPGRVGSGPLPGAGPIGHARSPNRFGTVRGPLPAASSEHVDHRHGAGRVRGIRCIDCNPAGGTWGDDPGALRRAIAHLEGNAWKPTLVAPGVYRLPS
ncbi:endonuclease domain-containing protein [Streptomyces sp. NPDC047970]|uniref:endonuclease domain-containing protein n=1 Tax=Streptomyces sp. NPDC047970 TaxID=3155481 RepID=UPI0034467072